MYRTDRIEPARAAFTRAQSLAQKEEPALAFGLARLQWLDGDHAGARAAAKRIRLAGEGNRALRKATLDAWIATH